MTTPLPPSGATRHQMKVPKMAEIVALELRRQIVRGELGEDDSLPSETALMEQFGVSRPTLREAFRVLESESLITVRRGARGGARVHAPSAENAARFAALVLEHRKATLQDVLTARSLIEPMCVSRLATSHSPEDLLALQKAVIDSRDLAQQPVAQMGAQTSFHALVVDLVGNETLSLIAAILRHIIDVANLSTVKSEGSSDKNARALRRGFRAHERVVELIEAGDAEAAHDLWRKHLLEAEDYLLRGDDELTVLELLG